MLHHCAKCQAEFTARSASARFCSRKCYPSRVEIRVLECPDCHKVREVRGGRGTGLCRDCLSDRQSGTGSPVWRGGHSQWSSGRQGRDKDGLSWKAQRKLAWERDNYTCQECKKQGKRNPDVHHISPFRLSQSHALENLKSLCQRCHMTEEAKVQEPWGGQLALGTDQRPKGRAVPKAPHPITLEHARTRAFIRANYLSMSQSNLARVLGISQPAVSSWFKRMGIHVVSSSRRAQFLK